MGMAPVKRKNSYNEDGEIEENKISIEEKNSENVWKDMDDLPISKIMFYRYRLSRLRFTIPIERKGMTRTTGYSEMKDAAITVSKRISDDSNGFADFVKSTKDLGDDQEALMVKDTILNELPAELRRSLHLVQLFKMPFALSLRKRQGIADGRRERSFGWTCSKLVHLNRQCRHRVKRIFNQWNAAINDTVMSKISIEEENIFSNSSTQARQNQL
ncbi:hypothetical protein RF11_06619 [Thelohanellus kitauei]|uniref:Uncharacterized protein n=1 Tax=Thelohanellus kitauei TaxID=669202 RepID=A0A0C2J0S1_THEKT|nr:hypothetical protein RF11_06619 [Thelohanellus kitauei]